MEPHPDLIRFAKQNKGNPYHYRRQPNGPHMPDTTIEVYGERKHNGNLQVLTFFLDKFVVWINVCPQSNPIVFQQA